MKKTIAVSLFAMTVSGFANAAIMEVYSTNFTTTSVAAGVGASLVGGFIGTATGTYTASDGKTWDGNYLNGNGGLSTLILSDLPTHTGVSIDMLLGFLNSWDGSGSTPGGVSPDYLNIAIDGVNILQMTTNNTPLNTPSFFGGGTQLINDGAIDGNTYTNTTATFGDDLVDMATASALTFAHTASTLNLQIVSTGPGWQGWPDEGWGMDSLSVSLTTGDVAVPEPATLALFGIGFAGLGAARRRQLKAHSLMA
ncbi:hypothetical protein CKO12_02905 [Chromatium okenii]|uniref:PEP-CTERM sorting domain-containing protein n=1 Tax=Chromatium okenii TaxID=61644 RepID=UPI0019078A91|nr:PEP-CTERM sorting domain-containing protein [Chromatium okenii]MBK1640844.1 hypothetical protein [Chromatium okenii]